MRTRGAIGFGARYAVAFALAIAIGGCSGRRDEPRFDAQLIPMEKPAVEGVTPARLPIASGARPILLSITIPNHMAGSGLETRILNAKSEIVWVSVGLKRAEGAPTGLVLIPSGFLRPGEYRLAVGKAQPGVSRAEFPFRVQ